MDAERAFLRAQAAQAKAALRADAHGLAEDLLAPLQVRPMVRHHPWLGLGAATMIGAVLGGRLGRRRPTPTTAAPARGLPRAALALLQRARRVATSTLGAMLFANLRAPAAGAAATAATTSPDVAPVAQPSA